MQWTGGWPSLWILSLRHTELRAGMQTGTKPKQTNFIASGIKAGWGADTSLQSQPQRAAGIPWSWVPPRQRLGKLSPASANKFRLGWASLALSKRMLCKDSSLLAHSPAIWIWNFWKCKRKHSGRGRSYQIPQFGLEYSKCFPPSHILAAVTAQLLHYVEKNYRSSKNCPWFHRLWDKCTKHRNNIFDKVTMRAAIKEARKITKFWNSYIS